MISEWINNGKGMKKENKQFVVFLIVMVVLGGSIGVIGGLYNKSTKIDPCKCLQLSFSLREKMDKKDSEYWDKCEVKFHSLEMTERECDEKIRDEKLERLNKN